MAISNPQANRSVGGDGALKIPLAHWADRQLASFASATGSAAIAALSAPALLGERAALNRFTIPGQTSPGGGCRLYPSRDGWIALNLARADDRDLLPALFRTSLNPADNGAIARHIALASTAALLDQGRALGLAIASTSETPRHPAIHTVASGPARRPLARRPVVVDLSALWAGPLAAHLLWLADAGVIKVESRRRPDAMRTGDPALFARLNQGKASVVADLSCADGLAALTVLLSRADIIIEAARPRALLQLGIDAARLVATTPGLTWITITGHGAIGPEAEYVGFGDDCAVAGGLTAAIARATGKVCFGGDAVADPLSGILAAQAAWTNWQSGQARRIAVTMSSTVARALADDETCASGLLTAWTQARGQPFPAPAPRALIAPLASLGADTARYLSC